MASRVYSGLYALKSMTAVNFSGDIGNRNTASDEIQ